MSQVKFDDLATEEFGGDMSATKTYDLNLVHLIHSSRPISGLSAN